MSIYPHYIKAFQEEYQGLVLSDPHLSNHALLSNLRSGACLLFDGEDDGRNSPDHKSRLYNLILYLPEEECLLDTILRGEWRSDRLGSAAMIFEEETSHTSHHLGKGHGPYHYGDLPSLQRQVQSCSDPRR